MAKVKTGGRKKGTPNKNTADLKTLAGKHGPWALKAIRFLAEHADTEQVRLSACRELLDRGSGKPPQYSEIGSKGGAPLTLVIETGVPAREPPIVNITPDTADIEPNGAVALPAPDPADINGAGDDG